MTVKTCASVYDMLHPTVSKIISVVMGLIQGRVGFIDELFLERLPVPVRLTRQGSLGVA